MRTKHYINNLKEIIIGTVHSQLDFTENCQLSFNSCILCYGYKFDVHDDLDIGPYGPWVSLLFVSHENALSISIPPAKKQTLAIFTNYNSYCIYYFILRLSQSYT